MSAVFDTSAAIDLLRDTPWSGWAFGQYERIAATGSPLVTQVVLAELCAGRTAPEQIRASLDALAIAIAPLTDAAAIRAGHAFGLYRARGGTQRAILADFLIAGHAAAEGFALVTRDRRGFNRYFPDLAIISPETAQP